MEKVVVGIFEMQCLLELLNENRSCWLSRLILLLNVILAGACENFSSCVLIKKLADGAEIVLSSTKRIS